MNAQSVTSGERKGQNKVPAVFRAPCSVFGSQGFTLIEVMIALGIFFAAVFTILALVSQILRNARGLQRPQVDAGMAAAMYVNTNRFPVGTVSGELGDSLADFSYEIGTDEFATNGLDRKSTRLNS